MRRAPFVGLVAASVVLSTAVFRGQEPTDKPQVPSAPPRTEPAPAAYRGLTIQQEAVDERQDPGAPPRTEPAPAAAADRGLTVEEVIARVNRAEAAIVSRMRVYRPLIEIYLQDLTLDPKLGAVPAHDEYFLGQFDWRDGPKMAALSAGRSTFKGSSFLKRPLRVQYLPDGFAALTAPDWALLDPNRYEFKFARREFL